MAEVSMTYFSRAMMRHVSFRIVLPFEFADFANFHVPFKTLYFLHGYTSGGQDTLSASVLAAMATTHGFAVVLPDGENSFYVDHPQGKAMYERYIAEELVAVTRKMFPLSDKKEDTFIGGISMGGYGALMLASRHPETFGKVLSLSAAVYPYCQSVFDLGITREELDYHFQSEQNYLENYDPYTNFKKLKESGAELPKIHLSCGEQDEIQYHMNLEFADKMEKAGIPLVTRWGTGAHTILYWNEVLPEAAAFMMKD